MVSSAPNTCMQPTVLSRILFDACVVFVAVWYMLGVTTAAAGRLNSGLLDVLKSACTAMKYLVGVTDNSWFEFLGNLEPDELNIWRPSGKLFRATEVDVPSVF